MLRTAFHFEGEVYHFPVPPTYFDYYKWYRRARSLLVDAFQPEPVRLARASLPQKLLAVRSGLASYGKNNVTYVKKLGSFYRLMSFYSDYESPVDSWQEKSSLPLCSKCDRCLKACPTGAIQEDRFMVRAELCLTYFNEMPSEREFPDWVRPDSHNSLVGCMRCQLACPYNKDVVGWYEERGRFSQQETGQLLARVPLFPRLERKLKVLGLDSSCIQRNLRVLLQRQR
jgi:epoxyqueuosine reductase